MVLQRTAAALSERPGVFAAIAGVSVLNAFANQSLATPADPTQLGAPQILSLILAYVVFAWMMGAAVAGSEGRPLSASLISPILRIPLTYLILVLYIVAVALASMLFFIPGVYLSIRFGFAPYLAVSGREGLSAFGASSRIVRGRWWNVFGLILLGMVPSLVLGLGNAMASGFDVTAMSTPNPLVTLLASLLFGAQMAYFAALFLEAERTGPESS